MKYSFIRIWKDPISLETFTMEISRSLVLAGGLIHRRSRTGSPQFLRYKMCLDHSFNLRMALVEDLENNMRLSLRRDDDNVWYNGNNSQLVMLNGCQTIDISCTPFTKSLPLWTTGCQEDKPFKIAYLNSSNLIVEPFEQVYKKIGTNLYEFEILQGKNRKVVQFDNCGLVKNFDKFITVYAAENLDILV